MCRIAFYVNLKWLAVPLLALFAAVGLEAQGAIQSPQCNGVLRGTIYDLEGQPVPHVRVDAWPLGVDLDVVLPETITNESGSYRFERLCPGRYTVAPADPQANYDPYLLAFLVGRRVPEARLTGKKCQAELSIQLPPKPGKLRILVSDRITHIQIRQFKIEVTIPSQHQSPRIGYLFEPEIQDPDIEVPPDKDFHLLLTAEGFHKWGGSSKHSENYRVDSGTMSTFEIQLAPTK